MTDISRFRIDGHKLHLHPDRVADWLAGKNVPPIYMEISPSGNCNHRCNFCALDYMEYQPRFLPLDIMAGRFAELAATGLKSVMFAGEGEPFLHQDMSAMAVAAAKAGLNVAFTTNGTLMTPERAKTILPHTSWIKVSFNAGLKETYARIHRTKPNDFRRALSNVEAAAALRDRLNSNCSLGMQMVLLPENINEAMILAATARDMGVDYLVIKPHAPSPKSGHSNYKDLAYGPMDDLATELAAMNTDHFQTIFRSQAMSRAQSGRVCRRCLALPFWAYMDAGGSIWGCFRHLQENDFYYGNILESSAESIFNGKLRREKMAGCAEALNAENCLANCRMAPVNEYLWELLHPGPHVNFI